MALPTSKQQASGEYTPLDAGTYQAALRKIRLEVCTEFNTGSFNGGEGLRFQGATLEWGIEDDTFTERFVKVSTNERAKFFNRISALLGRDLTEDDEITWKINPAARRDATLDNYFKASEDSDETGDDGEPKFKKGDWVLKGHSQDGVIGDLDDLLINGESIIGRECLLVVKVNDKGYNRAEAGAASPLPKTRRPKPQGMPS